jgi:hypothetical protein
MPRAKKAPEAPSDPLDAMLARLKLTGIREGLGSLHDEAGSANLSIREALIGSSRRKMPEFSCNVLISNQKSVGCRGLSFVNVAM